MSKLSSENDGQLKSFLKLRIYQRTNETFFVSKSFFWRRWHHGLQCCFSFEIAAVSSGFCFIGQSVVQWTSKSKITEIFSLFFHRLTSRTIVRDQKLSQSLVWTLLKEIFISLRLSEYARNDLYNPEFITPINILMNSG